MSGRAVKRTLAALVVIGAAGYAAMNPGAVKAFYEDLYPSDPAKRQALEMCFAQDHKFNRLDAGARDECYRKTLFSTGEIPTASAGQPPQPEVNVIDLRQAAGTQGLPKNDVRRQEQTDGALHKPQH